MGLQVRQRRTAKSDPGTARAGLHKRKENVVLLGAFGRWQNTLAHRVIMAGISTRFISPPT